MAFEPSVAATLGTIIPKSTPATSSSLATLRYHVRELVADTLNWNSPVPADNLFLDIAAILGRDLTLQEVTEAWNEIIYLLHRRICSDGLRAYNTSSTNFIIAVCANTSCQCIHMAQKRNYVTSMLLLVRMAQRITSKLEHVPIVQQALRNRCSEAHVWNVHLAWRVNHWSETKELDIHPDSETARRFLCLRTEMVTMPARDVYETVRDVMKFALYHEAWTTAWCTLWDSHVRTVCVPLIDMAFLEMWTRLRVRNTGWWDRSTMALLRCHTHVTMLLAESIPNSSASPSSSSSSSQLLHPSKSSLCSLLATLFALNEPWTCIALIAVFDRFSNSRVEATLHFWYNKVRALVPDFSAMQLGFRMCARCVAKWHGYLAPVMVNHVTANMVREYMLALKVFLPLWIMHGLARILAAQDPYLLIKVYNDMPFGTQQIIQQELQSAQWASGRSVADMLQILMFSSRPITPASIASAVDASRQKRSCSVLEEGLESSSSSSSTSSSEGTAESLDV